MEHGAEGLTNVLVTFRKAVQRLWHAVDSVVSFDATGDEAAKAEEVKRYLTDAVIEYAEDAEAAAAELGLKPDCTVKPFYGGEDREDVSGSVFRLAHDKHEGRDPNVRKAILEFLATAISKARGWQSTVTIVERAAGPSPPPAARLTVNPLPGRKVIIGHGASLVWREVKDFLRDELKLDVEEFDSVANAGKSIKDRLIEMKQSAGMAFVIMTAEDEQAGGQMRARQNVVHEVGFFQGALGFERAIILLEQDCEKFSNVDGIVYIGFPRAHVSAAFEKIRQTLRRERFLTA